MPTEQVLGIVLSLYTHGSVTKLLQNINWQSTSHGPIKLRPLMFSTKINTTIFLRSTLHPRIHHSLASLWINFIRLENTRFFNAPFEDRMLPGRPNRP